MTATKGHVADALPCADDTGVASRDVVYETG